MVEKKKEFAPLIDVSETNVGEIVAEVGADSPIGRCVQRLVDDVKNPNDVISAFQSFVE
jgi:hypothetical protein